MLRWKLSLSRQRPNEGDYSYNQRIVHLTEISAIDFPASDRYKYKCRVQISSEGQSLLEKDLFSRMQPNWLLELKNKGDCTINLTLCYREGDLTQPWQDAGVASFATQDCLNGELNADLEFPITIWEQAPQLKLKARLTQSSSEGNSSTVTVFGSQNGRSRRGAKTNAEVAVELPEAVTLTPPEEVIIKDVWNKLRAWKELQMEKFLKRLLLEGPELEYLLGETIDSVSDFFYELFDCAVHQLQPETQIVVGEPLMGVPPEKGDGLDTVEEYGALFADMGMRPQHWIKARQVWMWMGANGEFGQNRTLSLKVFSCMTYRLLSFTCPVS